MTKENYPQLSDVAAAIEPMVQPWLDQDLIPDPVQVISIARAVGISPSAVFSLLEQEPLWFSINGGFVRTELALTSADIANQDLRQLRSQVPRNRDISFTRFIWGEKGQAVIYRSRRRNPKRQTYVAEVKARTNVLFIPADPQDEARQQRLQERQEIKQRLAKRRGVPQPLPEPEKTIPQPNWLPLCQNPEVVQRLDPTSILTVGFGIDATVPLRVLSYPLLGLELLRQYPQMTLEMYVATQFAWLNQVDEVTAFTNTQLLQTAVTQFIKTAFPDIAPRVRFIPTTNLTQEQLQFIDQLSATLVKDPQLNKFAMSRNGPDSLRYLATHSLYMRDPLPINTSLYLIPLPSDSRSVVMVGGDGEKITWRARQKVAEYFKAPSPAQIFTTLGRTPPYFRSQKEPLVGETLTTSFLLKATPEIYRDFAALLTAIARINGAVNLDFAAISAKTQERQKFLAAESIQSAIDQLNQLSNP